MRIECTDALQIDRVVMQSGGTDTAVKGSDGVPENAQNAGSGAYLSEKTVINAIEKANKAIVSTNRQLEFSIHEKTKEIMVKVIDAETKEVIREIPPEKILDMVAKMMEMAGILVDERR
jgi:flagellar protein FlaG